VLLTRHGSRFDLKKMREREDEYFSFSKSSLKKLSKNLKRVTLLVFNRWAFIGCLVPHFHCIKERVGFNTKEVGMTVLERRTLTSKLLKFTQMPSFNFTVNSKSTSREVYYSSA